MLSDIGNYLQVQGIGTLGTNIFLGMIPDKPDNCIVLFEYAGSPPDLHWNGEYPGLQVQVRSTSYPTARCTIGNIVNILHGMSEQKLNGIRFLLIQAQGNPEVLKRDDKGRVVLFVNFRIIKER